jgi:large subunit ribosomal protein L29
MKFDELSDKTITELATQSHGLRQELFNLRLQQATAQLEKSSRIRVIRKNIARVETRITQLRHQAAQPKAV